MSVSVFIGCSGIPREMTAAAIVAAGWINWFFMFAPLGNGCVETANVRRERAGTPSNFSSCRAASTAFARCFGAGRFSSGGVLFLHASIFSDRTDKH